MPRNKFKSEGERFLLWKLQDKEIKEDTNKCSWTGRINIVKMSISHLLVTPIRIPVAFVTEVEKTCV